MAELRIYLTDGFDGDHVVVSVDGEVVFDRRGVTTKKLYGLAERLQPVQVPEDKAKVEVRLPDKNRVTSFEVDLSKGSHVPITLQDDRLLHSVQKRIGFM